eukprot:gene1143-1450_t
MQQPFFYQQQQQPTNNNNNNNNSNNHNNQKKREEFQETLNSCFSLIEASHQNFRRTVIRYAVRGIGWIACHDESLVTQSIRFLAKILEFRGENYQYLKRVCFHALSRIGRRYPIYHSILLSLFEKHYNSSQSTNDTLCSVLLAFSRLSQTNSQIRVMCVKRWLEAIEHPHHQFKSAGILSLGYASCPTGNIVNDQTIESLCYSKSIELLQYHKIDDFKSDDENVEDPWKKEEVYTVQVAATKALGLLVRSNLNEWLPKLSKVFKAVLSSPRYSGSVKACVLQNYGQMSYYLSSSSPFFNPLKVLLFELSTDDNPAVSSPSGYALAKFGLSHNSNYPEVKAIINMKIPLIKEAKQDTICNFLKTWCKLVSQNYRPTLNQCSSIISPFYSDLYDPNSVVANQLVLLKNRDLKKNHQQSNIFANNQYLFDNAFNDYQQFFNLCHCFSPVIINSILAIFKNTGLLDHPQFVKALKEKIFEQKTKGFIYDGQESYEPPLQELRSNSFKREIFLTFIQNPESISNPQTCTNIKTMFPKSADQKALLQQQQKLPQQQLQQQQQQQQKQQQQQQPQPQSVPSPQPIQSIIQPQPTIPAQQQKPLDPRLNKKNPFSKPLAMIGKQSPTAPTTSTESPKEAEKVVSEQPQKEIKSSPTSTSPTISSSSIPPVLADLQQKKQKILQEKKKMAFSPLPPIIQTTASTAPAIIESPTITTTTVDESNEKQQPLEEKETKTTPQQLSPKMASTPPLSPSKIPKQDSSSPPLPTTPPRKLNLNIFELPTMKHTSVKPKSSTQAHELGKKLMGNWEQPVKKVNPFSKPLSPIAKESSPSSDSEGNSPVKNESSDNNSIGSADIDSYTADIEKHLVNNSKLKQQPNESSVLQSITSDTIERENSEGNLYVGIDFNAPRPKPEPIICSFYKLGICKKGSECTYLHSGPVERLKPMEVCKFFKSNSCMKGNDCTYSHDLTQEPCKFFNSSSGCTNKECQYGHFISDNIVATPPMESNITTSPPQQFQSTSFQIDNQYLQPSSTIDFFQEYQQQQQQQQQQ